MTIRITEYVSPLRANVNGRDNVLVSGGVVEEEEVSGIIPGVDELAAAAAKMTEVAAALGKLANSMQSIIDALATATKLVNPIIAKLATIQPPSIPDFVKPNITVTVPRESPTLSPPQQYSPLKPFPEPTIPRAPIPGMSSSFIETGLFEQASPEEISLPTAEDTSAQSSIPIPLATQEEEII